MGSPVFLTSLINVFADTRVACSLSPIIYDVQWWSSCQKSARCSEYNMYCLRLQQPTSREMHSQRSRVPGKFAEHSRSREVEDSKTGEWATDQDRPSITYYHKSSCTQTQRSNLTSVIYIKSARSFAQALTPALGTPRSLQAAVSERLESCM